MDGGGLGISRGSDFQSLALVGSMRISLPCPSTVCGGHVYGGKPEENEIVFFTTILVLP